MLLGKLTATIMQTVGVMDNNRMFVGSLWANSTWKGKCTKLFMSSVIAKKGGG